jgi:hypothetical protein
MFLCINNKLIFLFLLISIRGLSQTIDTTMHYTLVGTIVNGENNEMLSGAHLISTSAYATKTDENGNFNILLKENDTLKISFVGFKPYYYVAPKQDAGKYLIKFKLYTDSIILKEVEIFPWPSYSEFKKAFAELKSTEPEIKMEGVKLYQDRNIQPYQFSTLHLFTNPISYIYDKLLDKKAKQRRRIDRRTKTINDAGLE